ncbi:MAG: GNAT family N-acetyltransferase [Terracidiphilus sp.]|jgi:ribosomal protein S18 acetylase RimI-like enzyme
MPTPGSGQRLKIELLDKKRHDRTTFSCGVHALDAYLQRQAAQDMEKHAAVVYVAVIEPPAIAGYYTLSQFSIDFVQLPDALAKRLPRYPIVPATLLGRLAVASALRGQRIGETLLFDALHRSLFQSAHIASTGVIVDAKDESAAAFYRRYGFAQILDAGQRLFLPTRTIEQMF